MADNIHGWRLALIGNKPATVGGARRVLPPSQVSASSLSQIVHHEALIWRAQNAPNKPLVIHAAYEGFKTEPKIGVGHIHPTRRNSDTSSNLKATEIEVTYVVRDHLANRKRTMLKTIPLKLANEHGAKPASSKLLDTGDVVARVFSPSKELRADFRVDKNTFVPTRRIELWKEDQLIRSVDVSGYHGDFYTDVGKKSPTLFILKWNTEDLPNQVASSITRPILLNTPSRTCFGQAMFSPLSEGILYATGYEYTPDGRMLGLRYCFNRPSGIWKLDLSSNPSQELNPTSITVTPSKITPPHLSCCSPHIFFHGSNAKLLWLSAATGGPHLSTDSLYSADIASDSGMTPSSTKPLVEVVDMPQKDGFQGLYLPYNLPSSPVLKSQSSDPVVVTYSQWGSRSTVLGISSVTGKMSDLTPDEDGRHFSWSVLATDGESRILATRSSPGVPYELMLGMLSEDGGVRWRVIEMPFLPQKVQGALDTIQTQIIPIPERAPVETIVTQSSLFTEGGVIPPCITWPHGGPHVGSSTEFSPLTSVLILEGYTISQPNYTGSLGYGDKFVHALLGRCGKLDVQDCMASAEHLISLGISEEGPGKQLITGGSHGGFLTVIGQYPTFFSAAVLRNAVTTATNISTTDIPDWYFSEFGLEYNLSSSSPKSDFLPLEDATTGLPQSTRITSSMYDGLLKASPIFHADRVCIPVLILAGTEDRRVAPSHSVEYYHALKARVKSQRKAVERLEKDETGRRGLDVELLMFEGEGHGLEGVVTSRVNFEVMREWFERVYIYPVKSI
ncbi:Alpha/Beta hydrolase protein [Panaeolus papilionaceus]|nr:Alpha/Beta hydrolase protein [Panaeolus papilionaceus]